MAEEPRKQLMDTFQKYLGEGYDQYCHKHGFEQNIQHFITYLIDRGLVNGATIRKYTILREFERLYPKHNFHKSQTVDALADLFNLSSRHIWSLIKYNQRPDQRKKQKD